MRTFLSRLLDVVFRRSREQRINDEIQAHLDLLTDEYIAQGISPHDARLAARRAFGGVDRIRMMHREQRGLPVIELLTQDVRFALRVLLRDRSFTLTAIVVLGVGLGVNNMFFTLVYAHRLRGVAVENVERVLSISTFDDRVADRLVSLREYDDLRLAQTSFSALGAYVSGDVTIGDPGHAPDRFDAAFVTASAFPMLGVSPLIGRLATDDHDRPGAEPVVMPGCHSFMPGSSSSWWHAQMLPT